MNNQTKLLAAVSGITVCAILIYTIERQIFPEWTPTQYSLAIQIAGFIFGGIIIREFNINPLNCFKVKSSKKKSTIVHCVGIIVICTAASIIIRVIMNMFSPEVAARPFIALYLAYNRRYIYPLIIIVQQFFAKAVVLDSILKEFNSTSFWKLNILSSVFFASLHLGYDIWIMIGAAALITVTNILYRDDENIYSSITLHFMCGFVAPMFGLLNYV